MSLAAYVAASCFGPAALAQGPTPEPPVEVVPVLPPANPAAPAPGSQPETPPPSPTAPSDPSPSPGQPAPVTDPAPEAQPERQPVTAPEAAPAAQPAGQPGTTPATPATPLDGVPVLPPARPAAPAPTTDDAPRTGGGLTPRERREGSTAPAGTVAAPTLETAKWKPFNGFVTGSALRRGPLGFMDFSLGLSGGDGPVLNNVAMNGGVRFNSWLRAHMTAVGRPGNWNFAPSNWLQEGYLEAAGKGSALGERLAYGVRFGKVQNLVFTPDPLSFFDELPAWRGNRLGAVPGYEQFVPFLDWQSESGLGFHATAAAGFLGSSAGINPINGYLRFRAQNDAGWVGELRGGYLTARALGPVGLLPQSPEVGVGYYLGRQWKSGIGLGLALEQTMDQPFRVGGRFSLPTSSAGQAFGNFLGRFQAGRPSVVAQLPLARLNLGQQATAPPPGGQLVGTVTARRIYRAVSSVGASQYPINDEYIISHEGETKGKGLVRVVTEGARSVSGFGGLAAADGPGSRSNTEYTQDVVYSYYRVVPFSDTWLEGKVYDKDHPDQPIRNLTLSLKAAGDSKPVLPSNGSFRVKHEVPTGKKQRVTLVATAPGYLEETFEANLSPGDTRQVEIPLRALRSGLNGRVVDETTGKPAADVEGILTPENGEPIVVLTGQDGAFRVPQVAPGRYTFSTQAPSYYPESLAFEVGQGQTQRLDVKIRQRPGAFAGKITNAADQPVGGAPIQVTGGDIQQQIVSLSDGSFGLNGLPAGTYRLSLTTAAGEKLERTVTLTAGDIATVDIQVK